MNFWDKIWFLLSNRTNSDIYALVDVYGDEDDDGGLEMVSLREKRRSVNKPTNFVYVLYITFLTLLVCLILSIAIASDNDLSGWKSFKKQNNFMHIHPETKTTILEPERVCKSHSANKLLVLILVCSTIDNFERRQLIRDTWGNYEDYKKAKSIMNYVNEYNKNAYNVTDNGNMTNRTKNATEPIQYDVAINNSASKVETMTEIDAKVGGIDNTDFKLLFFIGFPNISDVKNNKMQKRIETEAKEFQDIVQEGFIETNKSLTLKSVMMLKWVLMSCRENVRYIFKVEDDTFVNVHNLVQNLQCRANEYDSNSKNNGAGKEYLLIGHLHSALKPNRHPLHILFSTDDLDDDLPAFLTARAGYVISIPAAAAIYLAAQSMQYIGSEDVFITGHCAWRSIPRVVPRHDNHFSNLRFGNETDSCAWYDLVTAGHGSCSDVRRMHEQTLDFKSVLRCKIHQRSREL